MQKIALFQGFFKKISTISLKKGIILFYIPLVLLFTGSLISCVTSSSLERWEGVESARRSTAISSAAITRMSKSQFTQREMQLFYNTALGDRIIDRGKVFLPVTENRRPVYIVIDCNDEGFAEFFVLFAESILEEDGSHIPAESLRDLRNIFREDIYSRQFLLAVYNFDDTGAERKFVHRQNIILESKSVFSSLEEIEIDKNNKIHGLSINFITSAGTHEDIIIKARGTYSITSIRNSLSDSTIKKDITGNGVIDLLRYEKVFVDGLGVETFITWYRFTGGRFLPVRTVNTVQGLRAFFIESKQHLEAKRVNRFIERTVPPPVLNRLNVARVSSEQIMQRIFYPVARDSSPLVDISTMLSSGEDINIIFPEIFENPFRMDSEGMYSFTTYVRVLIRNGGIRISPDNVLVNEEIFLVKIYMPRNPFVDNRFFFFVN